MLSLFLKINGTSSQSEEKPHEGDLSVGDSSTINRYELGLPGPRTVQGSCLGDEACMCPEGQGWEVMRGSLKEVGLVLVFEGRIELAEAEGRKGVFKVAGQ